MKINRATTVFFVDRVEPTRDFFLRLGFEVAVEVPDGDKLGFAMVARDGVNIMVETRGNPNESPGVRELSKESRRAGVFVEVDDIDALIAAMKGAKALVERHMTFYNADEITYEEPGGNLVTFAQFKR